MSIYGNPVMLGGSGGGGEVLPSAYQQVEYLTIGASITNIIVPYKATIGDVISCSVSQQDWTIPSSAAVFGVRNDDSDSADGYRVNACVQSDGNVRKRLLYANVGQAHDYDDPTVIARNGTSVKYGSAISNGEIIQRKIVIDTASNYRVLLYGKYSSTEYTKDGNLYRLTVTTQNGETSIDLIPCYRKADSVCGFYDIISRRFYTAVRGSFTAGPDT